MKSLLVLSIVLFSFYQSAKSQEQQSCFNTDSCIVVAMSQDYDNKAQYSYQISGVKAERLVSNLFSESEVPTVGIHKIRNVQLEGLDQVVKLKIHMGLFAKEEEYVGFRTYQSEKHRTELLENQKEFEKEGALIYVLKNSPFVIKEWRTVEADHKLILSYLEGLTN